MRARSEAEARKICKLKNTPRAFLARLGGVLRVLPKEEGFGRTRRVILDRLCISLARQQAGAQSSRRSTRPGFCLRSTPLIHWELRPAVVLSMDSGEAAPGIREFEMRCSPVRRTVLQSARPTLAKHPCSKLPSGRRPPARVLRLKG